MFDVVLLDINMPGIDGFEATHAMNGLERDMPAIFLTGAGYMDYAVKAIHLGVYDFLTKHIGDLDMFNGKMRSLRKRINC